MQANVHKALTNTFLHSMNRQLGAAYVHLWRSEIAQEGPPDNSEIAAYTLSNDERWHLHSIWPNFVPRNPILRFLDIFDEPYRPGFYVPTMLVLSSDHDEQVIWMGGLSRNKVNECHQYITDIRSLLEEEWHDNDIIVNRYI